jgi:hypothetical protein
MGDGAGAAGWGSAPRADGGVVPAAAPTVSAGAGCRQPGPEREKPPAKRGGYERGHAKAHQQSTISPVAWMPRLFQAPVEARHWGMATELLHVKLFIVGGTYPTRASSASEAA